MMLKFLVCCLAVISGANAQNDLGKFEAYMNQMQTLEGRFEQYTDKGALQSGTLYISRPGKMRLEYDAPQPLLVVANGEWLITYDRELDDATYVSLDNTPAGFILRPHVSFSDGVKVIKTQLDDEDGSLAITVVKKGDEDQGQITLVYDQNPVQLREWTVVDGRGQRTRVYLSDLKINEPVSQSLFKFDKPNMIEKLF